MREIKFRAWDKENNNWLENAHMSFWGIVLKDNRMIIKNDDDFILMQYTGLKDKNGVEIYEGDIIEFEEPIYESEMLTGVIKLIDGSFGALVDKPSEERFYGLFELYREDKEYEIKGNIYENPELLTTPTT